MKGDRSLHRVLIPAIAGGLAIVVVGFVALSNTFLGSSGFDQTYAPFTLVGSTTGRINAVSCPSPGECVAVGTWGSAYLMTQHGGKWSAPVGFAPSPNNEQAGNPALSDVSCWHTGDCVAIGQVVLSRSGSPYLGDVWHPFVVVERDGTWKSPEFIYQGRGSLSFTLVKCWSRGNCIVGGTLSPASAPYGPSSVVVGLERRGHWQGLHAVTSAAVGAALTAAACTSTGLVCAVSGSTSTDGLAVLLHGDHWTTVRVAPPSGAPPGTTVSLWSASCAGSGFCAAAGYSGIPNSSGAGDSTVLVTDDHGTPHVILRVDLGRLAPHIKGSGATGIACWSAYHCLIVGNASDNRGVQRGLGILIQSEHNQAFFVGGSLQVVSCTLSAACTASGSGVGRTDDTFFMFGHRGVRMVIYHAQQKISGQIDVLACSGDGACTAGGFLAVTGDNFTNMPTLVSVQEGHQHPIG